jgi:uncharacterized protein (UPF0276 family)
MSMLTGRGLGIGWRPEIHSYVAGLPGLRWCEVIAESAQHEVPAGLDTLIERGVAVVAHGTRLSLGGAEPLQPGRVAGLAKAAELLGSPLASEHIAYVRADGTEAGHLLPIPRSRDALDVMVDNVKQVQAELPVPIALEPIAALLEWPDQELTEPQFITELLDRTGAWLLLDIANLYANARNHGRDPHAELAALPLERVAYCHIAGGSERGGLYHDTHVDPTPPAVLELVAEVAGLAKPPAMMLERDGNYPPAAELTAELDSIADAAGWDRIT